MNRKNALLSVAALHLFALGSPAFSAESMPQGHAHHGMGMGMGTATAAAAPAAEAPWTNGEVRKIDTAAGKLTLRHDDMPHLGMMGMTMVFKAADPALLQGLTVGQAVRFKAQREGGQLTVTAIAKR